MTTYNVTVSNVVRGVKNTTVFKDLQAYDQDCAIEMVEEWLQFGDDDDEYDQIVWTHQQTDQPDSMDEYEVVTIE